MYRRDDGDLTVGCPECGRYMPAGATFCLRCGAYMSGRGVYEDRIPDTVAGDDPLAAQLRQVRSEHGRRVLGVTEIMLGAWVALSLVMGLVFAVAPGSVCSSAYAAGDAYGLLFSMVGALVAARLARARRAFSV